MVPPVCPRSVAGRRAGEMPRGHRGGVWQKESGGCGTPRVHLSLSPVRVFRPRPDDTRRASGE